MLLDSNIIIYSAQPENEFLRQLVAEKIGFLLCHTLSACCTNST